MELTPFIWMFPCYFLAARFNLSANTGRVVYDDYLRLVTPEAGPENEKMPALFTDEHLAEKYRDAMTLVPRPTPVELRTPAELKEFILCLRPYYRCITIDPNPDVHGRRPTLIDDVLENSEWE